MEKFLVVLTIFLLMSGCLPTEAKNNDLLLELAVRAGTGRVLHENPSWIPATQRISEKAIQVVESGELSELRLLTGFVVDSLPDSMLPEEQALAVVVIGSIRDAVIGELERRGVQDSEEMKVLVLQVLKWINETAKYRM